MAALEPRLVASRYRLVRRIASGGMGEVWAGVDDVLHRRVAVKLLHAELGDDPRIRERFRSEAQAAARLGHPGAVSVYDYGDDGERAFLVMELVDGQPLSEVLRERGPLGARQTMSIVAEAASALASAHALGLVHRDVKPGNLLLRPDGSVKVADFGIARATDRTTTTLGGTVLGTVPYMSPEQVQGAPVGERSDIYSLGVVAYECLSGERPFDGDGSIAVALAHLRSPVPPLPPDVPRGVVRLVTAMLEKSPTRRPESARSVADAAGRLAAARPAARERRHRSGRRRATAGATAALLVVPAALAAAMLPARPGTASVTVPNLQGALRGAATTALRSARLRPEVVVSDIAGAAGDLVVEQHPRPGRRVRRGTTIRLTVASGYVRLPRRALDGLSYGAAASKVRRDGLRPTELTLAASTPARAGSVVAFRPWGNLREGSRVLIEVAGHARVQVVSSASDPVVRATQGASPATTPGTPAPGVPGGPARPPPASAPPPRPNPVTGPPGGGGPPPRPGDAPPGGRVAAGEGPGPEGPGNHGPQAPGGGPGAPARPGAGPPPEGGAGGSAPT